MKALRTPAVAVTTRAQNRKNSVWLRGRICDLIVRHDRELSDQVKDELVAIVIGVERPKVTP